MCDVSRSRLIEWVDGEAADGELEAHIAECAECALEIRRIRELSSDINEYCSVLSRPARRRRVWIPIAAAAALVLAAGLLSNRSEPPAKAMITFSESGEPGVRVVVPLNEMLPVGAAPPGAVLVGRVTFDAAGRPSRLILE